ncbi:MAG: FAD-binding oxidoreductase [Pseudomonadota bacterium]
MNPIDQLEERLGSIPTETHPRLVQQKSRDFYWYSPVLKARLDKATADIVIAPRSAEEIVETLSACAELGVPVTPRGAGTGNYGQAVPLSGGAVLDLSRMTRIVRIDKDRVVAEPGIVLDTLDGKARSAVGGELRMHPSTAKTATLGGFIAGGSGGVGSIRWGGLRAAGNILRVRVATMETIPRLIDLTGAEIAKINHAYGTNGILTEIEMPLSAAEDWVDVLIAFRTWEETLGFGWQTAHEDGLLLKELGAVEAPVPFEFFLRHKTFLREGDHVLIAMVAPNAIDRFLADAEKAKGRVAFRADEADAETLKRLPPIYELGWNHTTLRALRVDPSFTYLQVSYPGPEPVARALDIGNRLGEEVPGHVEFVRYDGSVRLSGLPLVRYRSEDRLNAIVRAHLDAGCPVYNPHRFTLEEGAGGTLDTGQLDFKRVADPAGLLNPGKMIAWHDPDYKTETDTMFAFGAASF